MASKIVDTDNLEEIHRYLYSDRPVVFTVEKDAQDDENKKRFKAEPLTYTPSWSSSFCSFVSTIFSQKTPNLENAKALMNFFKENPDVECSKRLTQIFDAFAKDLKKVYGEQEPDFVDLVEKTTYAMKAGIPVRCFLKYPDFYLFARANFLHRYLKVFPSCVRVNSKGEPQLKFQTENGVETFTWKEIREKGLLKLNNDYQLRRQQFMEGRIVDWDFSYWGGSKAGPIPFQQSDTIPPPWGNRYVFEVRTCTDQIAPKYTFDHTWFCLKTPEGKIYSIGFYRPDKHSTSDHFNNPCATKQGYWQCPDISDVTVDDNKIDKIPFEITEEEFQNILEWISATQRSSFDLYNLINNNCSDKVGVLLDKLGIFMSAKMPFLDQILPRSFKRVHNGSSFDAVQNLLRDKSIFDNLFDLNIRIVSALFFGGREIHPHVEDPNAKPLFSKISDLFSSNVSAVSHPFTVFLWGQDIKRLREEHLNLLHRDLQNYENKLKERGSDPYLEEQIAQIKREIEKAPYAIPAKYRTTPLYHPTPFFDEEGCPVI